MISNFQERIIAILQGSPNGLTSNEIAERLGATAGNISSRLSKLAAYGIIGKVRYSRGGNVYRALTYENHAAPARARAERRSDKDPQSDFLQKTGGPPSCPIDPLVPAAVSH
jgi:DNA-binding Lrp family transcriptional regulator